MTRSANRGFTLVEILVSLAIVTILSGVALITLSGSRASDHIDRGVQQIYDDLIFIRSRAVSTNSRHRINFTSTVAWRLESWDEATTSWQASSDIRQMPSDTYLTTETFANAAANIEATPRGLYDFMNGATGDPYVTVEAMGTSKTKSIIVAVGGALAKQTN